MDNTERRRIEAFARDLASTCVAHGVSIHRARVVIPGDGAAWMLEVSVDAERGKADIYRTETVATTLARVQVDAGPPPF